jgi:hypothetical protein
MRRLMLLVPLLVIGCGGGDSNAPNPAFPNASGRYTMTGGFDGFTTTEASFTGNVTLTQASQAQGALGGTASITARFGDQIATVSDNAVDRASVSSKGAITFTLTDPSGTWVFTGTLGVGSIGGGRHTLNVPGTGTVSGDWTGSRSATSVSAMSTRDAALGLGAIGRALTR